MTSDRRPALGGGRTNLASWGGLLLVTAGLTGGCLSPPPSRESPPSAAPPAQAPSETPLPPQEQAPPAAAPAATEGKASTGEAETQPETGEERRDRAAPPPRAASKRARSTAEPSPNDALAGAGAEPQKPAALRAQLERAERAATPDCPSARERKKAVCDLAGQICRLTDRDPNVASVAEYCADAKQRCNDAERRTAQSCPD
jgi:hypothetical protein